MCKIISSMTMIVIAVTFFAVFSSSAQAAAYSPSQITSRSEKAQVSQRNIYAACQGILLYFNHSQVCIESTQYVDIPGVYLAINKSSTLIALNTSSGVVYVSAGRSVGFNPPVEVTEVIFYPPKSGNETRNRGIAPIGSLALCRY